MTLTLAVFFINLVFFGILLRLLRNLCVLCVRKLGGLEVWKFGI
jgi:hypothetical protein